VAQVPVDWLLLERVPVVPARVALILLVQAPVVQQPAVQVLLARVQVVVAIVVLLLLLLVQAEPVAPAVAAAWQLLAPEQVVLAALVALVAQVQVVPARSLQLAQQQHLRVLAALAAPVVIPTEVTCLPVL
jgi:hypothetical protein